MTKTDEQIRLAYRVLDFIEANPERHDQRTWINRGVDTDWDRATHNAQSVVECGTTACVAGWTVLLSDMSIDCMNLVPEIFNCSVPGAAATLLGMDGGEVDALFWDAKDLADVRKQVFEIFGPRPEGAL